MFVLKNIAHVQVYGNKSLVKITPAKTVGFIKISDGEEKAS